MIVANGNVMFAHPHEWAGDRPVLAVASYPIMLRAVARQLTRKDCWLAEPLERVARDWDDDAEGNAGKLREVLAHGDLLTAAQVSRIRAALKKLQERSQSCLQESQ